MFAMFAVAVAYVGKTRRGASTTEGKVVAS